MHHIASHLVPLVAIIMGIGMSIYSMYAKHKERLKMIEQGIIPQEEPKRPTMAPLMWGLLLLGVAVGILLGNMFYKQLNLESETAALVLAIMFGGIALMIFYFLRRSKEQKEVKE
jgi:Na+/proline symporter